MPAWYSRAALIAALAVPALADYSPFKVGRTWVYEGNGVAADPIRIKDLANMVPIQYRETLTLKVASIRTQGDSTIIVIEERDSLYARKRWSGGSPGFPDTVIARRLTYVEKNGLRLAKGDSIALGHRDSADAFFPTASAAPANGTALTGLESPYRGVMSSHYYIWRAADLYVHGQYWYVDDVGLFYFRLMTSKGTCDYPERRELVLASLDGKPIDIGRHPLGPALEKEARIACGLAVPRRGLAPAFAPRAGVSFADILGRALLPAAP